jgi:hypothetical protein
VEVTIISRTLLAAASQLICPPLAIVRSDRDCRIDVVFAERFGNEVDGDVVGEPAEEVAERGGTSV